MRRILIIGLTTLLALPLVAQAALFQSQETVSPADPVTGDAFVSGELIDFRHGVAGDVFAAGGRIKIADFIRDDFFGAGQRITIEAGSDIGGNVFTAGSNIEIAGNVGDDIYAAGETIVIDTPKSGTLAAAGNSIVITDRTVMSGDAYLAGGVVEVNGTIEGDLRLAGAQLLIGPTAVIDGNLLSYGESAPIIDEAATITGTVTHRMGQRPQADFRAMLHFSLLWWVRSVITWFVITLLVLYTLPHFSKHALDTLQQHAARSLGLGVLWIFLCIPVSVLLALTIVGLPLTLALLALTALVLIAAQPIAALTIGSWVGKHILKAQATTLGWQQALLGVVLLKVLQIIPLIGFLVIVILGSMSVGALLAALWSHLRTPSANGGNG